MPTNSDSDDNSENDQQLHRLGTTTLPSNGKKGIERRMPIMLNDVGIWDLNPTAENTLNH